MYELDINSTFGNPTYTSTAHSKDEIFQNHRSILGTFNIPVNGMDKCKTNTIPILMLQMRISTN
jgi:hypothetical protein